MSVRRRGRFQGKITRFEPRASLQALDSGLVEGVIVGDAANGFNKELPIEKEILRLGINKSKSNEEEAASTPGGTGLVDGDKGEEIGTKTTKKSVKGIAALQGRGKHAQRNDVHEKKNVRRKSAVNGHPRRQPKGRAPPQQSVGRRRAERVAE